MFLRISSESDLVIRSLFRDFYYIQGWLSASSAEGRIETLGLRQSSINDFASSLR